MSRDIQDRLITFETYYSLLRRSIALGTGDRPALFAPSSLNSAGVRPEGRPVENSLLRRSCTPGADAREKSPIRSTFLGV